MLMESFAPVRPADWASMWPEGAYAFGPFDLDPARRVLAVRKRPVALTARCFDLLLLLIRNRHRMMSRHELFRALWPDVCVEDSNLTVNVCAVRKALGEDRGNPRYIATLPRRGYRFIADVMQRPLLLTPEVGSSARNEARGASTLSRACEPSLAR